MKNTLRNLGHRGQGSGSITPMKNTLRDLGHRGARV